MYELSDDASKVERVNAAWDRIEAKLGDDALEAPATEAELDQLEADLVPCRINALLAFVAAARVCRR